jgi:O-antigen/teichoic acid export membrane protein
MEFNALLKNTSLLAVTRLFEMIAAFVRIKITAITIGTTGMGIVDQLTMFTQKASTFTLLSLSEGVVKQISENKDNEYASKLIKSSLKSYIIIIFFLMLLSISLLLFFSDNLATYVFGKNMSIEYLFIGISSIPLLIVNSIPFAILKAFKNMKAIARARIYIVFINLLIIVPSILMFGLNGAVYSIPFVYFVTLSINYIFAKKYYLIKYDITLKTIFKEKIKSDFLKELYVFSGFGMTVGLYFIISEFTIRAIVVSKLGIDAIGLYSPVIMLASVVVGVILPSLSTYLYPRFCELKNEESISNLINDAIRLGSFALMPLLFIGIPFREFLISTFYSIEFIDAALYMPYHFIGVVFYVWWYVFSQSMTPTGRIKQHGIFLFLFYSLDILIVYLLIDDYSIYAWMFKYIITPLIFLIIYYIYAIKKMNFKLHKNNILLMIYILFSTIILIAVDSYIINLDRYFVMILGIIFMLASVLFLNTSEQKYLRIRLNNLWRKK